MNDEPQPGRFYVTPIQRVMALLVIALAIALCVMVTRAKPRPDRIWEWRFPDQSVGVWPAQLPAPAEAMLQMAPTNASNVFQFYRQSLGLPMGTGPVFMMRSRGFLFSRNMDEFGVVPSVSTTNLRTEMYLNHHRGQSKILLASQLASETNTAIWLSMVESADPAPLPIMAFLFAIEYPGSLRGSGGSIRDANGFGYTVQTNLAAIEAFYTGSFRTNAMTMVKSNALRAIGDSQAQLFRLPSPPGAPTNQVAFLLLTTRTMSLIHGAATGRNSVQMTIGVVTH